MKALPEYADVLNALTPVLYDLPGKIVAIDGRPSSGKTSLGRFLAWRFNITLLETDHFLKIGQGKLIYFEDQVARIIDGRIKRTSPRPVLVEGVTVLRLLHNLKRLPDYVIYVSSTIEKQPDDLEEGFEADLLEYEEKFAPKARADKLIRLNLGTLDDVA